jgi:hypothetical protein
MYIALSARGRALVVSARTHNFDPAALKTSGGCGYRWPFSRSRTGSCPRSLKNSTRNPAGSHQTTVSAVRASTRSGRISKGTFCPDKVSRSTNIRGVTNCPADNRAPWLS